MEDTENDLAMYATPKRTNGEHEIYPVCDDEFKPSPSVIFDSLEEGIDFYKNYAHHVGFSVRLSSTKKVNGIICWKYYYCSKEGWHKEKEPELIELELSTNGSNKDNSSAKKSLVNIRSKQKKKKPN